MGWVNNLLIESAVQEIEADALSASKSQQVKKSSTGGDSEQVVTCGGKTVVLSGMHIDDAGNEKRVHEPTTEEADSDWVCDAAVIC